MIGGARSIELAGETLWMHPDRALLWPAQQAVLVADTHFGKGRIFRHHGIAVPAGADRHDRQRLQGLLQQSGASRLLVLGDFLHGALEAVDQEIRALEQWLEDLPGVRLGVVAGNHDRHVLKHWQPGFEWHGETLQLGPLCLAHDATAASAGLPGTTLSGHVHPVWQGPGARLGRLRAPAFWRNASGLVLPSFGSLTGGYRVVPAAGEALFVVAEDAVMQVPQASYRE